jgi:hypothetical protein
MAQAAPQLVGVLDQPPCVDSAPMAVLPLFVRHDDGWISVASRATPLQLTDTRWDVVLDGKSLGWLATSRPNARPGHDGHFVVLPLRPRRIAPRVANHGAAFSTWCADRTVRPLIVLSQPHYADPERWRPFRPDASARHALFLLLQASLDSVLRCANTSSTPVPWHFSSADIAYGPSYADRSGRKLITAGLDQRLNHCDGPAEPEWAPRVFLLGRDTVLLGNELELVDAGDYAASGEDALLFWHSGYNEDGYTLFYDQFRKRVDYWWHYH